MAIPGWDKLVTVVPVVPLVPSGRNSASHLTAAFESLS